MGLAYNRQQSKPAQPGAGWAELQAVDYGSNAERQNTLQTMPVSSAGPSWLSVSSPEDDEARDRSLDAGPPDWALQNDASNDRVFSQSGALEALLLQRLALPKPSFQDLARLVAETAVEERSAAFRSQQLQEAIARSALGPGEQLALSTALAEGSLQWGAPRLGAPGQVSDFFRFFVLEDAKGPPPEMTRMNCFELVLYSAWRLGQIPTEWIVERGNEPEGELSRISYPELGWSSALPPVDPGAHQLPAVGDVIFVTAPGSAEPWHVILSLGGDQAMSLWKRPTLDTPARRLALSEYADQILQFGAAPWNR